MNIIKYYYYEIIITVHKKAKKSDKGIDHSKNTINSY